MKKFNIGFFAVILLMLPCMLSYATPSLNYLRPGDASPEEVKKAIDEEGKKDKGLSSNTGLTRLVKDLRAGDASFADVSIAGIDFNEAVGSRITTEGEKIQLLDNLNRLNLAGEVIGVEGGGRNIAEAKVQAVLVMDNYMINLKKEALEEEIGKISPEKMLVILITSRDNVNKIEEILRDLGRAGDVGKNIALLDITKSKTPFQRLFSNREGFLDLSEIGIKTTKDILSNKDLIEGLATAK